MQILLDTIEDSPEELNLAREIIRLATARRAIVPAGTPADALVSLTIGSVTPSGKVVQIRNTPGTDNNHYPKAAIEESIRRAGFDYKDGTVSILEMTRTAGFGKCPLPPGAIAIDVPESFTAPAATPAACVTGVPAAPAQTTAPTNALPATTIAAASPIVAPPVSVTSASETVASTAPPATAALNAAASVAATSTTSDQTLATGAAPASAAVEEDADGYIWDKRIHSSSKKKHSDGRWHLKRNVAPELVAKVKTELRAAEVADSGEIDMTAILAAAPAENRAALIGFSEVVEQMEDAMRKAHMAVPAPPPPPPLAINPAEIERLRVAAPPAPHYPIPEGFAPAPLAPRTPVTPATAATLNFTPAQIAALGTRADQTAPPVNTIAVVPPAPATPALTVAASVPAAPIPPAASVSAAESLAPPPAPPAAPASGVTTYPFNQFKDLMAQVIKPAMDAKKIFPTDLSTLCKGLGLVNGLPDLLPDQQPPRPQLALVADAVRRHIGAV